MTPVGRRRELAAVQELLDRAERGNGGLLVLTWPAGAGKTTLTDAAAASAHRRKLTAFRASGVGTDTGRLMWNQLLRDVGAAQLPDEPTAADLDRAARDLAAGTGRVLLIEDVDRSGGWAVQLLARLASRLATAPTAVLVTSGVPLGLTPELHLGGLSETDLAGLHEAPLHRLPRRPNGMAEVVRRRPRGLGGRRCHTGHGETIRHRAPPRRDRRRRR